ncbi:variant chaperonin GroEL3 [Chlamydia vaughanii]|uniref:variant chaperonin GroEL3 n=1 Tax=Chlamydia vaughanii TaxID=3112552 RepID=UPI0032B2665B
MLDKEKSLYDTDKKLFLGIDKVFLSIKEHYGPNLSSLSLLENQGYLLLSRTTLSDPYENIGVDFAKDMANKIYKKHRDGITTGVILLYSLLKASYPLLDQGLSLYKLCCALKKMGNKLLEALGKHSWLLKDSTKARGIIFSAIPDYTIATNMSEAFATVGPEGFISLSQVESSHIHITQGLKIPYGYISPYFISQSTQRTLILSHPRILVTDKKITTLLGLLPLLQEVKEHNEHLLIFCNDIDEDVLSTFTVNKLEELLQVVVVCINDHQENTLFEDISLFTGTNVFSQPYSPATQFPERASLGSCDSIEISEEQTILIRGNGVSEVLGLKIRQIEEEIRISDCQNKKAELVKRKHRLQSSVAIIPVKEEDKFFYSLALSTLTSALEKGYIPGGGTGLFYAALDLKSEEKLTEEEKAAVDILQTSCRSPLEQLATNAKLKHQAVTDKLLSLSTSSLGMNAASGQIEDMIASGILDPLVKIEDIFSLALETALNILSSKVIISEQNK